MTTSPWRVELGVRVKQCRAERGWSVRQVTMKSGVARTTWKRLEAGHVVSDWALTRVADCLGWPRGQCFRIIANALDDAEQHGR